MCSISCWCVCWKRMYFGHHSFEHEAQLCDRDLSVAMSVCTCNRFQGVIYRSHENDSCWDGNGRWYTPVHKPGGLLAISNGLCWSSLDRWANHLVLSNLCPTEKTVLVLHGTSFLHHRAFPLLMSLCLTYYLDEDRSKLSPANEPEPRKAVIKWVAACHHIVAIFYNTRRHFSCTVIHLPHQVQPLPAGAENIN